MTGEYSVQVGFAHLGLGVFACHINSAFKTAILVGNQVQVICPVL